MIYLLVGYMWLFIHRPFEIWPWLGELRIERVYMLITLGYWGLCAAKTWTPNRVNWGIGLLLLSMLLSTAFSPFTDFSNKALEDWLKVLVFFGLIMTSVQKERDLKILVLAFVTITALYELHSLREFFCGRGVYRMGTWRMVGVDVTLSDPNSFAATVNYGLCMLIPTWRLASQKWHRVAIIGAICLGVTCILLTGSRSGFVVLGAIALTIGLASRYRWRLIPLLIILPPLIWINLSENLQNRYMTLIDPSRGPSNAQGSAESRKEFFFMACDIWKQYPIFGVGPGSFSIASGTGMQSHSLYAQTISNLGSLGVLAVLTLLAGYWGNLREAKRYRSFLDSPDDQFLYSVVLAVGLGVVSMLIGGLAGHNLFRYHWLWYAAFSALAIKFLRWQSLSYDQAEQLENTQYDGDDSVVRDQEAVVQA